MKRVLSEDILNGCKNTEKIRSGYFNSTQTKACALGAAMVESGIDCDDAAETYPIIHKRIRDFPAELIPKEVIASSWTVSTAIFDLNDDCDWSREAIAVWIKSLEDYLEEEEIRKAVAKVETPESDIELIESLT